MTCPPTEYYRKSCLEIILPFSGPHIVPAKAREATSRAKSGTANGQKTLAPLVHLRWVLHGCHIRENKLKWKRRGTRVIIWRKMIFLFFLVIQYYYKEKYPFYKL